MKIESKKLLKAVSKAATVVDNNAILPIIKNILFKEENGSLFLHSTDLETSIKVPVTDVQVQEGLSVAVQAKTLLDLLKVVSGNIELTFGDNVVKVKASTGSYKIATYPGTEFPLSDVIKGEHSLKGYLFERAVDLTYAFVSDDDLRPTMRGIYFDGEKGCVVATDGFKLSKYEMKIEGNFILPVKNVGLLKGLSDADVYYTAEENFIHFVTPDYSFKVRMIEGNYPPYERVIPQTNEKSLSIDQKELQNSVKRVSLFADSGSRLLTLDLTSKVLSGSDTNFNTSGEEVLNAETEGELKIGLNSKYLSEVLNTTGEGALKLTFSEATKPVLVYNSSNPKLLQLIMPLAL